MTYSLDFTSFLVTPFTNAEIITFLLLIGITATSLLTNNESKPVCFISVAVCSVVLGILLGLNETPGNRFLEYYLYFWLVLGMLGMSLLSFEMNSFMKW